MIEKSGKRRKNLNHDLALCGFATAHGGNPAAYRVEIGFCEAEPPAGGVASGSNNGHLGEPEAHRHVLCRRRKYSLLSWLVP